MNYGTNATLFNLQDMSLGVWIKLNSSSQGVIIAYGTGSGSLADNTDFVLAVAGSSGSWGLEYGHDYGSGGATDQYHTFSAAIPNDRWVYVGFTRDTTAKTVKFYIGNGNSIQLLEQFAYTTNHDGGTSSNCLMQVGNHTGSAGPFPYPFIGTAEEHYVSSAKWTLADHESAMRGNPSLTGLVLGSVMGDDPEVDISGNGNIGAVTGTTLVSGHN